MNQHRPPHRRIAPRLPLPAALLASALCAEAPAADWPQLLGPGRDGVSAEVEPLPVWGEDGPAIVWRIQVGAGFAGPAVGRGRLFLFHRQRDRELLSAFDPASGAPLWEAGYPTTYRDDFGFDEGPRATPTVAGERVFTHGAQGVLTGFAVASGERLWQVHTHERFAVRKGFFGVAASPLVSEGRVLVNVGGTRVDGAPGDAGIAAFDARSGELLWTATDHEASYSSAVQATIGGRATAIFLTREGLVGLDPASGRVRFEHPWRARIRASVNAATPLVFGDRVFLSAAYGTGATLVDLGNGSPRRLWASDDVLTNHYATAVHHDGFLYGYHGRQESGPSLRAVELASGKVAWSEDRFGAGTLLRVADQLLVLRESGELLLARATPDGFAPLASARLLPPTVRAYPALAGGRLYARNGSELICAGLR